MANELRLTYTGTNTVYCIIRRLTDGYVWNGSAFAAWNNANIATYDIPLTSLGGDLYATDLPAALTASTAFRVTFYRQAGASPAITDQTLNTYEGATAAPVPTGPSTVTVADIVREARRLLSDDHAGSYRWSDQDLIRCTNGAHRETVKKRPELKLQADGSVVSLVTLDALADTLIPDDEFTEALGYYAAAKAMLEDDPDANAKQAQLWMTLWAQKVMGVAR